VIKSFCLALLAPFKDVNVWEVRKKLLKLFVKHKVLGDAGSSLLADVWLQERLFLGCQFSSRKIFGLDD